MKIEFSQIMDYVKCPIIYLVKNVYGITNEDLNTQFQREMKKVINHFFFRVMDNTIVSVDVLKNKWEALWFDSKGIELEDVLFRHHETKTKMGYQGVNMIENFHRANYDDPGVPLAVDFDYEVPIGKHIVTGTLDLVREIKEGYAKMVEVVHFSTSNYVPDEWETKTNLYTTLQSYAFRKEFQTKEQRLTYYLLKTGKTISTIRSPDDFSRLENFVDFVCTCIDANLFYPRPTYICRSCAVKEFCEQWGIK